MIKIEVKESKNVKKDVVKGKFETEVSIPFSRFPMAKWQEWWKDCQENFNSCRWFKAWSDHLRAKNSVENAEVWKKIVELEIRIEALTSKPAEEQPDEGPKNLHGDGS